MGLKLQPKVYIDGDIILYSCGFATQRRWYKDESGKAWPTITAAKDGGVSKEELECVIEAEPFSHASHSANLLIKSIVEATKLRPVVVLSGPENYRKELSSIFPYKGTRTQEKPVHYDELKKFLEDAWKAEITEGIEADDFLGAKCSDKGLERDNDNVMATLDKDLDMVPGLHYNWKSQTSYHIDHEEGLRNFFYQVLIGDKTDNIVSPKGLGPVKANKLLKSTRSWYNLAKRQYVKYLRNGNKIHGELEVAPIATADLGEFWLHQNMDLLWIRRAWDDEWRRHTMWFDTSYHEDGVIWGALDD